LTLLFPATTSELRFEAPMDTAMRGAHTKGGESLLKIEKCTKKIVSAKFFNIINGCGGSHSVKCEK
jgi:hypothetical protein